MRRRRVLALTCALLLPATARADDVEKAQALFNVGAQAYAQGEFTGAIEAFEEAYRTSARPGILFSIAQAHRKQYYAVHDPKNLRAAIEHYRAYVGKVSSGKFRVIATEALGELEGVATKLGVNTAPAAEAQTEKPRTRVMISTAVDGARVALDNDPPKPSPLIADVTPGKHSVRIEAEGYYAYERPIVAVEGGLLALDVPLREQPAHLVVRTESGADVIVDKNPVGRTPLSGPIELGAGTHFVAVVHNGRQPYGEQVRIARGETKTLDAPLAGTGQRVVSYVLFTAAAVSAVAGGVFVGLAYYEQGLAEGTRNTSTTQNITQSQLNAYSSALSAREAFKDAAYAAFGGGVALAVGASLLLLFDRPRAPIGPTRFEHEGPTPKAPAPLEVSAVPFVSPSFLGAGVVARF